MQEITSAHHTLFGIVAKHHAVDTVEEDIGIDDRPRHRLDTCQIHSLFDAILVPRMGRHDVVRHAFFALLARFQVVVSAELAQEGGHGIGVVTGARHVANAQ